MTTSNTPVPDPNALWNLSRCWDCQSGDIMETDLRTEIITDTEGHVVCVDYECEDCNALWTVVHKPAYYHRYTRGDEEDAFDETCRPLADLHVPREPEENPEDGTEDGESFITR